jgi:MFS family permease
MDLPRIRTRHLVILSLYGLALSMTASSLDPPVFTAKVNQIIADSAWRNTALGIITFLGLLIAAVAQPVWGTFSDHASSRWGRRIPFLVGGSLANLLLFYLLAVVGELWLLGVTVLCIQISSNAVQGAYQGLIPDRVPATQMGVAAGVKSLVEFPAVVVGPLVVGILLGMPDWPLLSRLLGVAAFLQIIYIAVTLLTLWHARRNPASALPPAYAPRRMGLGTAVRKTFRADWREHHDLRWWLLNRFLFWFALLTLRSFLINYMEQVIGFSAAEAQRVTGLLGSVLGLLIFLVVLPSGYIADRVGRRRLLTLAGLLASAGTFVLLAARSLPLMFFAGLIIGLGGGLFVTSSWALATEMVPKEEAARYLGLTNLATAGGSAAARLTGPLIDGINFAFGTTALGYMGVYALGGVLFLLSSWAIGHVARD